MFLQLRILSHLGLVVALVWAFLPCRADAVGRAQTAVTEDAQALNFDLPEAKAVDSMKVFSERAKVQVLYAIDEIADTKTNLVKGRFLPEEALRRMFSGTQIEVVRTSSGSLILRRASSAKQAPVTRDASGEVHLLPTFSVTGSQLQSLLASEAKRDASRIVDSITADEVGALPDFSVAEAITRLPGISYEGRNGDAQFIVIRGIRSDFNYLEMDGGVVPSTQLNRRATQLSIIPSSIIKSTDVIKSFSAELDGNSVGGQISVRTLSAFDSKKPILKVSGALGRFGNSDGPVGHALPTRSELTLARTFGRKKTLGVVLSATQSMQQYDTWLPGVSYSFYDFYNPDGSRVTEYEKASTGAVLVPHGAQMYQYDNRIDRRGAYAKLEYRPDARFSAMLAAYVFEEDVVEQRWDNQLFRNRRTNTPGDLTATSGHVLEGRSYNQYFWQGDNNKVRSVMGKVEFAPGVRHKLSAQATYSEGERSNPYYQIRFDNTTANEKLFAYRYNTSGDYPVLTMDTPSVWTNRTLYSAYFYDPRLDKNSQKTTQAKLDYEFNADRNAQGLGFKAGMGSRSEDRIQDRIYNSDYRPNSTRTKAITLAEVASENGNHFSPELMTGLPQVLIDPARFFALYQDTADQWKDGNDAGTQQYGSDFSVNERISSAYLQGQYSGYRYKTFLGLRNEWTELDSSGWRLLTDSNPATPQYEYLSEKVRYQNILPSVGGNWDPLDDFRVRASVSRTLGRAEYSNLNVNGSEVVDDGQKTITVSSGNPSLKPRKSDNGDLSFEYYLPGNGMVSVGFFNKEIHDEIYTRKVRSEVLVGSETYIETSSMPVNVNKARLSGIEMGLILSSLRFVSPSLKDFGVSANYSMIQSSFDVEMSDGSSRRVYGLLRQPRRIGNLSVFWAPGSFEMRVAFRHSGKSLYSVSASSPTYDEFLGSENRVDIQTRYKLSPRLMCFFEGRNLTGKGERQLLSYGPIHYTRDYGTSFWAGITYKH